MMRCRSLEKTSPWDVFGFDETWKPFHERDVEKKYVKTLNEIEEAVPKEEVLLYALVYHVVQLIWEYDQEVRNEGETVLCRYMDNLAASSPWTRCDRCPLKEWAPCYPDSDEIKAALAKYKELYEDKKYRETIGCSS